MHKLLPVGLLFLGLPLNATAQIIPHAALFGGYTYVRAQTNTGSTSIDLNGWEGSLELKPASWLGGVVDVSRQYGSPGGIREDQTTVLIGPQISVPGIPHVIPFAHAMAGFVHGTNQVTSFGVVCTVGTPCPNPRLFTGTAFGTAVGGGMDIKVAGPVWIRAIQADWLHGDLNPDHHTQARLATGVVIRFGR